MATICWTTYCDPKTLVNVGMDAVAMQCGSLICFIDLKTGAKNYYNANSPTNGQSVSHLAGHNRFPLIAFAEAILRPNIYILKYPEMSQFTMFSTATVPTYIDMRFSEFDHFIALTGYPNYMLYIWNFRTGQLLVEHETQRKFSKYSMQCSGNHIPMIALSSEWQMEISFWDMYLSSVATDVHEVGKVSLAKPTMDSLFTMCFADDGNLYVVDAHGVLSTVEIAQFLISPQWFPDDSNDAPPRAYSLYYNKHGLIVANSEKVYFVKKKNEWVLEWTMEVHSMNIVKMISSFQNEIYAANDMGNLYRVDYEVDTNRAILAAVSIESNINVLEFVILKGIKEESILMLTSAGDLRLADIIRANPISTINVKNGHMLTQHNVLPFVAVATTTGEIHFISFEKTRAPVNLGSLEFEKGIITDICLLDNTAFVKDNFDSCHVLHTDFKQCQFFTICSFETEPEDHPTNILQIFLLDETHAAVFNSNENISPANELWIYQWWPTSKQVRKTIFDLPFKYRSITLGILSHAESHEFYGVRFEDYVIDMFDLQNFCQLVLGMSVKTNHSSHVIGITGNRNFLTWGADGAIYNFKTHKKSSKLYAIARYLHTHHTPCTAKRVEECYNAKYAVFHYTNGILKAYRLPLLADNLRENTIISETKETIKPRQVLAETVKQVAITLEPTDAELKNLANLNQYLVELADTVRNLIDYDISVTGNTHGIFRKFCLNFIWLDMLNEQARILFEIERNSLLESIADQTRIREWILRLLTRYTLQISIKVRSIFSDTAFENYALRKSLSEFVEIFDLYRFYEMEQPMDEDDATNTDNNETGTVECGWEGKVRKIFAIHGSAYEHVMALEFLVQDKNFVTANQMNNEEIKFRLLVNDALKQEFNKKFVEVQKLKQETMASILSTNGVLSKIHSDMNCMLDLLKMESFEPEPLAMPKWWNDEILERIMTVADSEIKAINRRKEKALVAAHKSGRMLLWAEEFWMRALYVMMDGVLEKLWEEEIKKEIPMPEFMMKKQDHEYSLEDQKQLREYEEKLVALSADRRKYLDILSENERKTIKLKDSYIRKLNEKCAEMEVWKLKYDFAIKHFRLRLLNTKNRHYKRIQLRKRITTLREDIVLYTTYHAKHEKLWEYWEKAVIDLKNKLETLSMRDKTIERQFRGQYLSTIPAHLTHEVNKLFKRRPKMLPKSMNSTLVCMEVAVRIVQRSHRLDFPLPAEVLEYLHNLEQLDDIQNSPNQLDPKHWDNFIKLRRQKIENEMKIKGTGYQLLDATGAMTTYSYDMANLKTTKLNTMQRLEATAAEYKEVVQNQFLQLTLSMGQVEITIGGALPNIRRSILMHVDDLNNVNASIKAAGAKKLKAMQKVAFFRRQVIFKEWEHKVYRANIDYLKYMLQVIQKCKVTIEFLQLLREWHKVKELKKSRSNFGVLERAVSDKVLSFRKNLERINGKIDVVKGQIEHIKHMNNLINTQIDDVQISVAFSTANRDVMVEEKRFREQNERMAKIKQHRSLLENVRLDYAHILELTTILELQRLRTYPTLGPAPPECDSYEM